METAVVAALAAFLPALLARAGQRAGEEVGAELGAGAGRLAVKLWDRIRGVVLGDPIAKAAAEKVAERPDDPRATGALELRLEDLTKADAALRADLAAILEAAGDVTAREGGYAVRQTASNGGVNVGRDNTGTIRTRP